MFSTLRDRTSLSSLFFSDMARRGGVACVVATALIVFSLGLTAGCGEGPDKAEETRKLQEHALMVHAYKGEADAIKALLAQGVDANARDERGGTALMQASIANKADAVKLLLEHGAEVNAQSDGGNTALIAAAGKGHADILRILLDAGADPLIMNKANETAAVKAAFSAHSECVVLLKTAEVGKENESAKEKSAAEKTE